MGVQVRVRPPEPYSCARDGLPTARRRGRSRAALGAVARAGGGGLRRRGGRRCRLGHGPGRGASRRARHRHRPARRRRARPVPGAARARRRRPGALPHGSRRGDRSPLGLQRRRRRLREQAVSLRRGRGAPARAAAPLRGRRVDDRRCAAPGSGGALDQRAGRRGLAHPDRVPAAGGPRRPTRRCPAPPRARPRSVARRRDRPRQHARPVRGAPAPQAARDRGTGHDRDLARGRLPAGLRRFHTLRGRLTALGLLAALAAVAVLTVAFNVILDRSLNADANARVRSLAAAAAATVDYKNGRLLVHESVDDAIVDRRVWIFDGARAVERPPATAELQRTAEALAGSAHVFDDVPGGDVRLYAAPVNVRGRQVGTVVAAQSLTAYDRTTDLALLGSVVLGLVLLAAVGALTWITVGRALDPVREMTASAADWSERDLAQRFGATPRPDELGELARTFAALLARVAASLRHEQRLSAELSHELRTPLARIVAEIELLQRRERSPEDRSEALATIARSAEQMRRILETLMAAARAETAARAGRSALAPTLAGLAGDCEGPLAERGVTLEVAPATGLEVGADAAVVERVIAPLLDNAGRHAKTRVTIGAGRSSGRVLVHVHDDGPGIDAG